MTAIAVDTRPDERTKLLEDLTDGSYGSSEELLSHSSSSEKLCSETINPSKAAGFPWRAVIVILVLNAVQPLIFELVFPFMILDIGVVNDPGRVGFYSGIIESLFAVMSFIFVIPCSFISDRYGRKPVVLISIAILALSTALFGFSKSYWFMIVTRASGGLSAASWSTTKVMLAELTDKSSQVKAFAVSGIAYKIGQILGQPIGGLLSHPERTHSLFDNKFWRTYPYAFPCLFSSYFAVLAVIAGCFTLNETNPRIIKENRKPRNYGSVSSNNEECITMQAASWSSILTPHVVSLLISVFSMTIASETLFALYTLFAFTPVEFSGLGCSEAAIGIQMAVRSFIVILLMFLFTPMQSRFGTVRTYKITMMAWPLSILCFPFLNLLKRWDASTVVMDSTLCFFFVVWGFANCSWPASSVMINDAAPSADSLAAINGISQMAILLPQAIVPAATTSLFAWSITSDIFGEYSVWIILFIIITIASSQCLTLTEPTNDWREDYKNQMSESTS